MISGVNHSNRRLTKETWDEIFRCKESFLNNQGMDNRCPEGELYDELYASWERSRNIKIDPHMDLAKPHLSPAEFKDTLEKNRLLIEIIKPLFQTFANLAVLNSGFIIYLCDENGAFLAQEGEMMRVANKGLIWNEQTIGTCVHSMCKRLKEPVQLWGPEHYNTSLQNIIASAAPILDEAGEVMAVLVLSQPFEKPWLATSQNLCAHTLALITALAIAVEALLKLNRTNKKIKESYDNLKKANEKTRALSDTLENVFSIIDEGIITVDQSGWIIHINKEGTRILKLRDNEIGKVNINNYLCNGSNLMRWIKDGKKVDVEETLCIGKEEERAFIINIRPIENEAGEIAAVLKLTSIEKVNSLAINRSGSVASYTFADIKGEDKGIKASIALAKRFARADENILLSGESGTGKELFAQAIHNAYRPQGPFMAVNCAAIPRELIESELFGYEGGSFTGAEHSGKPGKIELANGGTLFLDEIGDLPLELQAVLLRTIEDKQVMRIGGRRYKKVDFRLITATNKDLIKMINEKQYREDLYFRLSVLTVNIPPLRSRGNDIEILCKLFIEHYCKKQGRKILRLSPDVLDKLKKYRWPGNVRQLQNTIIYAVNTAEDDYINLENLPQYILLDTDSLLDDVKGGEVLRLENLEKAAIGKALLLTNNHLLSAAETLGISRSTLYRKLKEYNLKY